VVADDERWERLVSAMLQQSDATYGAGEGARRAFGSTSLKTNGKIFAMLVKGRLVVKLHRKRVDAMVAVAEGEPFDPGHGRIQKEWIALTAESDEAWLAAATESEAFVAGRGRTR
jgi:TfoX/Sxy family transcriptional regulator of competence genes